jgi:hypothetical protein
MPLKTISKQQLSIRKSEMQDVILFIQMKNLLLSTFSAYQRTLYTPIPLEYLKSLEEKRGSYPEPCHTGIQHKKDINEFKTDNPCR